MIEFKNQGSFSILKITSSNPNFSKVLNESILEELQQLNRFYRDKHVKEKVTFIENRINVVENDLKKSERLQKEFSEKNMQINSPSLTT